MSGERRQTISCERCQKYQHEIIQLQARIFVLESEKGLHDTIPVSPSGKKSTYFSRKATFNLNQTDTVSFPKLGKDQSATSWIKLGAKPKRYKANVKSPAIQLTNRFLPLSDTEFTEHHHEVDKKQHKDRQSVPNVKDSHTLLIGDGAISGVVHERMITCSFPSSTVSEITSLLPNVLSTHRGVKQLIVHVGAVDIRKEQTEVLKKDFMKLFEELDKVQIKTFISGPLPNIDRKINKFSRLLQLNTWLSKECAPRGLHYIENFYLFWKREDLFKGKGPHLCRGGARVLTENLLHALRHQNGPGQGCEQIVRGERNERRIPAQLAKDQANASASAATKLPTPQKDLSTAAPPGPAKDSAPAAPISSTQSPTLPPVKNSSAAAPQRSPPPPVEGSSSTSVPLPPGSSSQAMDRPVTGPAAAPSSPLPSDQSWVPPATSTPTQSSLSFSSPPSPMGLPSHLESLIKSGIKTVPLTPNLARSRVLMSTMMNSSPYKPVPPKPQRSFNSPASPTKLPPPLPPRLSPGPSPKLPPALPIRPLPGLPPRLYPTRPPPPPPKTVISPS